VKEFDDLFPVGAVSSLGDVAGFSRGHLIKCTSHYARRLLHYLLKLKSTVVMRCELSLSCFPVISDLFLQILSGVTIS